MHHVEGVVLGLAIYIAPLTPGGQTQTTSVSHIIIYTNRQAERQRANGQASIYARTRRETEKQRQDAM